MQKIFLTLWIFCFFALPACTPKTIKAPCNNYGQNCEPKIKINQWTP